MLLCSAPVPAQTAAFLVMDGGTFLMEVKQNALVLHSTELGLEALEQYISTVTLGLPQQESSTVQYVMPVETSRASMWGFILTQQVSPVHSGEICFYSKNL